MMRCETMVTQQTRHIDTMLVYCWAIVCDAGPILNKHYFNVLRLLGIRSDTVSGCVCVTVDFQSVLLLAMPRPCTL